MRRFSSLLLALALLSPAVADPLKDEADLEKRFESSPKQKKDAYAEFKPLFEDFAKKNAGTVPGVKARLWVLQNTWWLRDDKGSMEDAAAPIADAILKDYAKSDEVAKIAEWKYVFRKEKHAELLAEMMKPERPPAVRAAATLASAIAAKNAGDGAGAKALFETLVKDFGTLKQNSATFADLADAYLNPLNPADIQVGKTAPEIKGASADGKPMKLSDYAGRVVVVDFFGDW